MPAPKLSVLSGVIRRVVCLAVQAGSMCRNKKPALDDQAVQGGKRFMPFGVTSPHDLGQAGGVRS
jgi:hypothetical protein